MNVYGLLILIRPLICECLGAAFPMVEERPFKGPIRAFFAREWAEGRVKGLKDSALPPEYRIPRIPIRELL
jgi:hypothetical protein